MRKAFGSWYYSLEDSFVTKREVQTSARQMRDTGRYFVRVAKTGWLKGSDQWGVFLRSKR